jgi:hypothetical protein
MARDMFSIIIPFVVVVGAGLLIGKMLSSKKDAESGWPYVVVEPTETNMLMQSLVMRPAVNAELNYLYGSAPAVNISNMTNMIVGTPLPTAIYN